MSKLGKTIDEIFDGVVDEETVDGKISQALEDAKAYTDNELASLKIMEIVATLPDVGEPNKIYLVLKTNGETNDLYDEYLWANNTWEYQGTKKVEVELTDYVKTTDWATTTTPGLVQIPNEWNNKGITRGNTNATLEILPTTNALMDERKGLNPLVPKNIDYAVKLGLTTNTNTLTDEEKSKAKAWLGITDGGGGGLTEQDLSNYLTTYDYASYGDRFDFEVQIAIESVGISQATIANAGGILESGSAWGMLTDDVETLKTDVEQLKSGGTGGSGGGLTEMQIDDKIANALAEAGLSSTQWMEVFGMVEEGVGLNLEMNMEMYLVNAGAVLQKGSAWGQLTDDVETLKADVETLKNTGGSGESGGESGNTPSTQATPLKLYRIKGEAYEEHYSEQGEGEHFLFEAVVKNAEAFMGGLEAIWFDEVGLISVRFMKASDSDFYPIGTSKNGGYLSVYGFKNNAIHESDFSQMGGTIFVRNTSVTEISFEEQSEE